MLQSIRDRLTGWLVWFVVGLIIIPFAFWGIESFRTGGGDPVVVKVGDQEITQSQFRAAYEQRYQQFQAMMGERFRADQFDQTRFRQAVLDDITQEAMLRQFVRKSGYRADDAALFKTISAIPAFQDKGRFSADVYKAALASKGLTPQRFETQLRDSVEIDQIRENVLDSAFVTSTAAAQAYRLANQQRELSYAVFDSAKYAASISVNDAQLKARYDADQAKYMAPERVKLAYVELSAETLPKAEAPSKDALQVIYNAEKDARFTTPEERKASHILVNFGGDKAAAKKKAEELLAKVKAGASFAEIAKNNSDDSGSKTQGGELGWIKRGQMPEKFEQPLFALTKAGEMAGPVETEFGWHLIKLDELKPVKVRPFEDATVQAEILELYRSRESQRRLQEETDKLEQLAFENPTSLDAVVKALNLPLQTTDWFTRAGGPGIAANDAVKQAAFSKEIVIDGDNSKPIVLAPGKVVVIRKAEYEAPRQKKLDEVIEQVRASVIADAAKAKAATEAQQMAAAARAGRPLAELAAARGVNLKTPGLVRRDNATEDRDIVDALFRLPRPKAGDISAADIALPNGNVAVVALSQVKDTDAPAADAKELDAMRAQLRDATAGAEFADYRKWIEGQIKVKVENPPTSDSASAPQS